MGEKLPHALALQLTDHLTPALLLSLMTFAVRLVVVAATSDVGGVPLKATEMTGGGVGGVLEPPPQAVNQIVAAATAKRWIVLGSLIEHLHCLRYAVASDRNQGCQKGEAEIRWNCGSSPDGPPQ